VNITHMYKYPKLHNCPIFLNSDWDSTGTKVHHVLGILEKHD